jgi:hypothetical protein
VRDTLFSEGGERASFDFLFESTLHLNLELFRIIFKDSVRTSKRTLHITITKVNWLMLFKEVILVYTENHTEPINTNTELLFVKAAGTYIYH